MQPSSLPLVGFDRFVPLVWMDKALDVAYAGGSLDNLRTWLRGRIDGEAALKKTTSVLSSIWLRPISETEALRGRALALFPGLSTEQRIVLHWGMCLATYPLFRATAGVMGRLLRLQGEFRSQDIRNRVLEQYGSIGTVPRAVNRIVQSVKDWGAITYVDKRYLSTGAQMIENEELLAWLFEACLSTSPLDHWGLNDLLQATELFPFALGSTGHIVLRRSPCFVVTREGLDREVVFFSGQSSGQNP